MVLCAVVYTAADENDELCSRAVRQIDVRIMIRRRSNLLITYKRLHVSGKSIRRIVRFRIILYVLLRVFSRFVGNRWSHYILSPQRSMCRVIEYIYTRRRSGEACCVHAESKEDRISKDTHHSPLDSFYQRNITDLSRAID